MLWGVLYWIAAIAAYGSLAVGLYIFAIIIIQSIEGLSESAQAWLDRQIGEDRWW
jgi:hypothetical protein